MKIAVVGAGGFVGRGMTRELAERGHDVLPVPRGVPMPRADAVVYLARTPPLETLRAFETARALGTHRFVFVSSVKVNGEGPGPYRADDTPAPEDDYARGKLETEQFLREAGGMDLAIVRPPLVYGPGVRGNFGAMVKLVRRGIPVPAAGDNRRSLIGRTNLCSFLELCCRHPDAPGEIFLVSDGEDVSAAELVRLIGGRPIPVPPLLLPHRIHKRLFGSLMIAPGTPLGWHPPVSLALGVSQTVAENGEASVPDCLSTPNTPH